MAYYNVPILLVFFFGSVLSIVYVLLFLRWRKNLDYARFARMSDNQNQIFEMINGMSEIKLNNAELQERWNWERIQAKIFKLNVQSLALEQWQMTGSRFIDQLKNIIISFLSAKAVIEGQMTLGMMLSVSYIIGQMNAPIEQLLIFFKAAQDASISLDRLKEIHDKKNEDSDLLTADSNKVFVDDMKGDLTFQSLSFKYNALDEVQLFDKLDLVIPEGKITAIVGSSGSGKTTLLKLLLKFYESQAGDILLGTNKLTEIPSSTWRSKCGVVMQDGYIFGKTISENIALGAEQIDYAKLRHAVNVANIKDYIEELPLKYNTKIGSAGNGLSQGQKQRILIARAVYKNPDYIFFDEATSALDANNESVIMKNLDEFFKGKTVIVVAHRLSTVKNADKIVVLEKGNIIEEGTHEVLTAMRGAYYNLVKNQLELGN
jgi:ATP-binding cassette subfamily B protein